MKETLEKKGLTEDLRALESLESVLKWIWDSVLKGSWYCSNLKLNLSNTLQTQLPQKHCGFLDSSRSISGFLGFFSSKNLAGYPIQPESFFLL